MSNWKYIYVIGFQNPLFQTLRGTNEIYNCDQKLLGHLTKCQLLTHFEVGSYYLICQPLPQAILE